MVKRNLLSLALVLAAGAVYAAGMLDFYSPVEMRFSSADQNFKAALVSAGTPPYNDMARLLSTREFDIISDMYAFTPAGKVFKVPAAIGFLKLGPKDKDLAIYTFSKDLKFIEKLETKRVTASNDPNRTVYIAKVSSLKGKYFALLKPRAPETPFISSGPAKAAK